MDSRIILLISSGSLELAKFTRILSDKGFLLDIAIDKPLSSESIFTDEAFRAGSTSVESSWKFVCRTSWISDDKDMAMRRGFSTSFERQCLLWTSHRGTGGLQQKHIEEVIPSHCKKEHLSIICNIRIESVIFDIFSESLDVKYFLKCKTTLRLDKC